MRIIKVYSLFTNVYTFKINVYTKDLCTNVYLNITNDFINSIHNQNVIQIKDLQYK